MRAIVRNADKQVISRGALAGGGAISTSVEVTRYLLFVKRKLMKKSRQKGSMRIQDPILRRLALNPPADVEEKIKARIEKVVGLDSDVGKMMLVIVTDCAKRKTDRFVIAG